MHIENPNFKLLNYKNNIFDIRKNEFLNINNIISLMLQPIEELGFECEFEINDIDEKTEELSKSYKKELFIKMKKDEEEKGINLSLSLPSLIDDNYIYVNGRKKIPQFQLFDIPIVWTKYGDLQIRTNIGIISLYEVKTSPHVYISIIGKKVPLSLFLICYYGIENINKIINNDEKSESIIYNHLLEDIEYFKLIKSDDYIKIMGEIITKYNQRLKSEELIYIINLIPKLDIFISQFLKNNSIIDQLIESIKFLVKTDNSNLKNKRLRCIEYLIYNQLSKFLFNFCLLAKDTKKFPKFNINKNQIMIDCNVSNIILFDFSINPIDELTKLSRLSLLGPGGFDKNNTPEYLRDVNESMYGRICPVDTPDRDGCGVQTNLVPNVKLNDDLTFSDENSNEKHIISIPVTMVPFLEKDDPTRLQMSSSQMRQSIMLQDPEKALIQSGCEYLYTNKTQFIKRAKKDGFISYISPDDKFIIVVYNDKDCDIIDTQDRRIYVEHMDIMKILVKEGDKVKKDDIIAESNFCINGDISFGRNLLTGILPYHGFDYEDAIVISDKLNREEIFKSWHFIDLSFEINDDKILLSLNEKQYQPLPIIKQHFKPNIPYAIIKNIPKQQSDYNIVFDENDNLSFNKLFIITDSNIYVNSYNQQLPQYTNFIQQKMTNQYEEQEKIKKIIKEYTGNDNSEYARRNLNKFLPPDDIKRKYEVKGEPINGLYVELFGVFYREIEVGDKIANRHGNKGVISSIVPEDKMPLLDNGKRLDIIINPLSVPSRMNMGQIFELHLSMSLIDLKNKIKQMLNENKNQNEIKEYLLNYINIIDCTDGWYYKEFNKQLNDIVIDNEFIDNLTLIQPPFESISYNKLYDALQYTQTKYKYELFEPILNQKLLNDIAVGYMYFFRMVHIAEERLAARSIGSYTKKTLQPTSGIKFKGGQRAGEMEVACIISHEGMENLKEILSTKSDSIDLKNKWMKESIESLDDNDLNILGETEEEFDDSLNESVRLLNSNLIVVGIDKD